VEVRVTPVPGVGDPGEPPPLVREKIVNSGLAI